MVHHYSHGGNTANPNHSVYQSKQRSVSASFLCDDEDAISPCLIQPPTRQRQAQPDQPPTPPRQDPSANLSTTPPPPKPSPWRGSQPHFDPLDGHGGDHDDPEALWRRMLTIQRIFGCYNSARMQAALELGDEAGFVPSRTCLDLLNDSVSCLPPEAKRQLDEYLERENRPTKRANVRKNRLVHH